MLKFWSPKMYVHMVVPSQKSLQYMHPFTAPVVYTQPYTIAYV